MKNKILLLTLVCAIAAAVEAGAVKVRKLSTSCQGTQFVADSIDYRKDLTRLYGRLKGTPHTSQRIDRVTLESAGVPFGSTDIDGVDMERWFQWEDDGEIPVEIDFPAMKPAKQATVKVVGPRGESLWTITRQ